MNTCGNQQNVQINEDEKYNNSQTEKKDYVINEKVPNEPMPVMYGNGGWLPPAHVMAVWREKLVKVSLAKSKSSDDEKEEPSYQHSSVQNLQDLININLIINNLANKMIEQDAVLQPSFGALPSIEAMLLSLDQILGQGPQFVGEHLIGVPIAALFTGVNATLAGQSLFRLKLWNDKLTGVLQEYGKFLNTTASWTTENNTWLTPKAIEKWGPLDQWVLPTDKYPFWDTWNHFFARNIKLKYRPIAGSKPINHNIVTSGNDGFAFRWRDDIKLSDTFYFKDMPYSLTDILGPFAADYAKDFVGGKIFQTFLDPFNFHRWWTPVAGEVLEQPAVLPGLYYSKLVVPDIDGTTTASCPYLLQVNCRGIVIVDTAKTAGIGKVCIVPIGMAEVSSIEFSSKVVKCETVTKGQELGNFLFGGSSFAIIFENAAKYGKQLTFMSDDKNPLPVQTGNRYLFPKDAPSPSPMASDGSSISVQAGSQIGFIKPLV